MKTNLRRKMTFADMCFLQSFESKSEAQTFAESLREQKKWDAVRMQKAVFYGGKKTFYRIYGGNHRYYL